MQRDQQLLFCLNLARTNPGHYARMVQKQLNQFQNDLQLNINEDIVYQTSQGKKAWFQALQFLQKQSSLNQLISNEGLFSAAKVHVQDMSQNGIFGHEGSDSSSFRQRIQRFCRKSCKNMVEIIGADFQMEGRNSHQMIILSLIIDDGFPDRSHREAIFNRQYKYVGVASGKQQDKIIAVLNMSGTNLQLKRSHSELQKSTKSQQSKNSICSNNTLQKIGKQNIEALSSSQSFNKPPKQQQISKNSCKSKLSSQNSSKIPRINQSGIYKLPTIIDISPSKTILEKKQSVRTLYENDYKISEITTIIKFTDGSIEENTQRITKFLE